MLYAIVSDIHANLVAWKAVLADIATLNAGKIICLGDVVGYGPHPSEVMESVHRHVDAFVMGNHDAVVAGKMNPDNFNAYARKMILWNKERISERGRTFLGSQPLILSAPDFVCVHGSLVQPNAFNYILTSQEALQTWQATDKPLIFAGHSHIPAIFVLGTSGQPHLLEGQDFEVEVGKRYIVNVGSVGDPRDGDPRASYCLYDDENKTVSFRRAPFDYDELKRAFAAQGLSASEIPSLQRDPVARREAVRDSLGFAPPDDEKDFAQGVALAGDIGTLKKTNRFLRCIVFSSVLALMAVAGAATALTVHGARKAIRFFPEKLSARELAVPSDLDGNLISDFPSGALNESGVIPNWRYSLADTSCQQLKVESDSETHREALEFGNSSRSPIVLEAPLVILNGLGEGRVCVKINAARSVDYSGTAAIVVVADANLPSERVLLTKQLLLRADGRWGETRKTMDTDSRRLDASTQTLSFRVQANFKGKLRLAAPSMTIVRDRR